ncbi:MAG: metalloregulator ArsR/SmtB family transcription factor [Actinobacteria bacterium]|nr:metalloregulator ArsR/SmtB family transcription factor [Actinomycetota bacterium]
MTLTDYEEVLKAAADPVRARMLKLLEGRELCVCEMMEVLGLGQSTISGHLALLKKACLVTARKDGRWVHYSLSASKSNQYARPLLALMLGWLEDDARVRADRRRLAAILEKASDKCS